VRHILYEMSDFTRKELWGDPPNQLAKLVCEGGLAVCKVCGKAEVELEDNPECKGIRS
jgi:hypothetical protein